MLIGCGCPVAGAWARPETVAGVAALAERLGYHELWTFQRLLVGAGQDLDPVYRSVLDPLLTLAYAAARTTRIRLGVAVVNLPFVAPAHLAKQAATLDVLSGGRHDLGLGTGWSDVEFAAVGADPRHRGARAEEYLPVLRALWRDAPATADGPYYPLPPSVMAPPPVQPGGPPVLLGGAAPAALDRAGRLADGWVTSSGATLDDVARGAAAVRAAARAAGRDPAAVRIVVRGVVRAGARDERYPLSGSPADIRAGARRYAAAGATELFHDLNWDPLIGSPDADPALARERAEELLTALAP